MSPSEPGTYLAHALTLGVRHGPGPWPGGGHPLPDDPPRTGDGPILPSVVMDGIRTHHSRTPSDPAPAAELADLIQRVTGDPPDLEGPRLLHDRLAAQDALAVADDLVAEVRRRRLPRERVRAAARQVAEHATRRNAAKLAITLLGASGDERDRDLLLMLGGLEELTLFAIVALMNTQPDRLHAAYELARRVDGWGRIHVVERLKGCDDPEIKGWLLRAGFRNEVMDEYLAHLAATTGDLYSALLEPEPDDALLDGAGGILAALARGGPAEDMHDYGEAVPAMHRWAELVAAAEPTLGRLGDLLTVARFVRDPGDGFDWPDGEPARLAARYDALLDRPAWRAVVRAHLADPVGPYGFNKALSCAGGLGLPILPEALAHLEGDPLNAYVWQWAVGHAADIGQVAALAERLLPLDEIASGPGDSLGMSPAEAASLALEVVVNGLPGHPGAGLPLLHAALACPVVRIRRAALRVLSGWPRIPPPAVAWLAEAAGREPDPDLRAEMAAVA